MSVPNVVVIGIDIGTVTTRVAELCPNRKMPVILRNHLSNEATPTSIAFVPREVRYFGEAACPKEVSKPQSSVGDLKRWWTSSSDATRRLTVQHVAELHNNKSGDGGEEEDTPVEFSLSQVMAFVLRQVQGFRKSQHPSDQVYYCVALPVVDASSTHHVAALNDAFQILGVDSKHVITASEPEAVATYFHHLRHIDLPASTATSGVMMYPCVIVNVGHQSSYVLGLMANKERLVIVHHVVIPLGASVIDDYIVELVLKDVEVKHRGSNLRDHLKSYRKVLREVHKAKEMLSSVDRSIVQVEGLKDDIDVHFAATKLHVEEASKELIRQVVAALQTVRSAMHNWFSQQTEQVRAGYDGGVPVRIEMIGAGWRSPCIQHAVKDTWGVDKLGVSLDSNLAVAEGCAILATVQNVPFVGRSDDATLSRDGIHNMELCGFATKPNDKEGEKEANHNNNNVRQDQIELWRAMEVKMNESDEFKMGRQRATDQLESFILSHRDMVPQCTKNMDTRGKMISFLDDAESYLLDDDCNHDSIITIQQKLAEYQTQFYATFAEVVQFVEAQKQAQRDRDAELERLSKLQDEDKELKSDPQRLRGAQQRREQGASLFKQEHWEESQTRFVQALSILGQLYDISQEETKTKKDEIAFSCHLNIASCSVKLGRFRNAVNNCSKALDISVNHGKALFRRGQAYSALGEFKEAEADLERALNLTSGDAAVLAELEQLRSKVEKQKVNEKKMFTKMFA